MSDRARAALEAHGIPPEPTPGSYEQILEDAIADVLATGRTTVEFDNLAVEMRW